VMNLSLLPRICIDFNLAGFPRSRLSMSIAASEAKNKSSGSRACRISWPNDAGFEKAMMSSLIMRDLFKPDPHPVNLNINIAMIPANVKCYSMVT